MNNIKYDDIISEILKKATDEEKRKIYIFLKSYLKDKKDIV